MSRIFHDKEQNRLIVLSYAGGTKFFNPLAQTLGYTHLNHSKKPKPDYILQVVREPIQRWMSWFDKQFVTDIFRRTKLKHQKFDQWCKLNVTKQFIDDYFQHACYKIHYDGHTAFQCYWPKAFLKDFKCEWKYLQMENINAHFLNQKPYIPKRDKAEYLGLWDIMDHELKEHTLAQARKMYAVDIDWYNNLKYFG